MVMRPAECRFYSGIIETSQNLLIFVGFRKLNSLKKKTKPKLMDLLDQFEVQLSKVSIMTLYNGGLWVICFLVYMYVSQPTTCLLGRLVSLYQSPKDMIVVIVCRI